MGVIGQPVQRVDGPAKVTGAATYAAEFRPDGLAYAAIVPAPVPHGRVTRVEAEDARAMRGVLAVLTHQTVTQPPWEPLDPAVVDPGAGSQLRPLDGPNILFAGQPVAVVVAESQETARMAAGAIRVEASETQGAGCAFDERHARAPEGDEPDYERGDAEAGLSAGDRGIDARYLQPDLFHNAMEPHATIARWEADGGLTLWDKTQWVGNAQAQIARNFGLDPEKVRVISPYVGGAFGASLRVWPHVALTAMAARETGRPVRLELTRRQLYAAIGYRPRTLQRVRLAAKADGALTGLSQTAWLQTSTYEDYTEETLDPPATLYDVADCATSMRVVPMDVNTPTPMRGPGAVTGAFALEIAMDEMAEALGMDPLAFRLRNHAERDQQKDLPYSSNALKRCYAEGAERFGWTNAPARREGRVLVGHGMASAIWASHRAPASARITLFANGSAILRSAASDMGPGTYTAMSQVAADRLGLPVEAIRFDLGDSTLPAAPVHGGSITMASVGNAVMAACDALRAELETITGETVEDPVAALRAAGRDSVEVEGSAAPGDEAKEWSSSAFGAVFAEVHVDPDLGTIRVPRLVGAYDGGVIVNPRTARSQATGGMVMGVGMALMEGAERDERYGRVMNANLAEYLCPVNADIGELDAHFVESADFAFNPLGAKGIAEIALCGVAPAIANAASRATGLRFRDIPLTPDRLFARPGFNELAGG